MSSAKLPAFESDALRNATQKWVQDAAGSDRATAESLIESLNSANKSDNDEVFSGKDYNFLMDSRQAFVDSRVNSQSAAGQLFRARYMLRSLAIQREQLASKAPEQASTVSSQMQQLKGQIRQLVQTVKVGAEQAKGVQEKYEEFKADPEGRTEKIKADLAKALEELKEAGDAADPAEIADTKKQLEKLEAEGPKALEAVYTATLEALEAAGATTELLEFNGDPAKFNPYSELSSFIEMRLAGELAKEDDSFSVASIFGDADVVAVEANADGVFPAMESIAGKSAEEISQQVDAVIGDTGANAVLYHPDKLRVTPAQNIVARMKAIPDVRNFIMPQVKRMLDGWVREFKGTQPAGSVTILDDHTNPELMEPMHAAYMKLARQTARNQGMTKTPVVVLDHSPGANAWVMEYDSDRPRVTMTEGMLGYLWDEDTNDFIKAYVDDDGNFVDKDAPGAKELNLGEQIVESVLGHEFGHIRDQVMLYRTTMMILMESMGVDMTLPPRPGAHAGEPHRHDNTPWHTMPIDAARYARERGGLNQIGAPRAAEMLEGIFGEVMKDYPMSMSSTALASALGVSEAEMEAAESAAAKATDSAAERDRLMGFILRSSFLNQAFESTADRHGVALQGDYMPTQWADYLLSTQAFAKGSLKDKVKHGNLNKPQVWAMEQRERLANDGDSDLVQASGFGRSHPENSPRILNSKLYVENDEFYQAVQQVKKLPPEQRLLAMIQVVEQETDRVRLAAASIEPWDALDVRGRHDEQERLEDRAEALEARFEPLMDTVIEWVLEEGVDAPEGSFVDFLLEFIEQGGNPAVKDESEEQMQQMMSMMMPMAAGMGVNMGGPQMPRGAQFDTLLARVESAFGKALESASASGGQGFAPGMDEASKARAQKRLGRLSQSHKIATEANKAKVQFRKQIMKQMERMQAQGGSRARF